jgi:hypothetical protein
VCLISILLFGVVSGDAPRIVVYWHQPPQFYTSIIAGSLGWWPVVSMWHWFWRARSLFCTSRYGHILSALTQSRSTITLLCALISEAIFVDVVCFLVQPAANSSGIPAVKAYLNGSKVKKVFNLKTLITKILGAIFAVSTAMPVGPEGNLRSLRLSVNVVSRSVHVSPCALVHWCVIRFGWQVP